jgi:thiol-disulfide isomerase/thioredoxin
LTLRASILLTLAFAACSPSEPTAENPAAPREPTAEAEAVPGLPRDQWLTAQIALPVGPDGTVVRDEKRRPYGYAMLGATVPEFSLARVGGAEVTQDIFRDKWTIVDVWGVWCGDCRRDAPYVQELAAKLAGDPDLSFLAIHTPPSRARAAEAYGAFGSIEAYFQSIGGGYPTVVDADASVRDALKIVWTPTYLLVGPDLTVRAFRTDLSVGGDSNVDRVISDARRIAKAGAL